MDNEMLSLKKENMNVDKKIKLKHYQSIFKKKRP
jgi:hypothetical protein